MSSRRIPKTTLVQTSAGPNEIRSLDVLLTVGSKQLQLRKVLQNETAKTGPNRRLRLRFPNRVYYAGARELLVKREYATPHGGIVSQMPRVS